MARYYPAFLDLKGKLALVVGGGPVGLRKAESLLACGARVRVVSPGVIPSLSGGDAALELNVRPYRSADLDGVVLAFAATDDPAVNAQVARDARARGILVNVADAPALCDFIIPALVNRGGLQIAISTGGASPALARHLRRELEQVVAPEYAELVALLESLRERILVEITDPGRRRAVFAELVHSDLLALIQKGDRPAIQARVEAILGKWQANG